MPAEDASTSDASVTLRAYEPEADRAALWAAKTDFETALGDAGDDAKAAAYADKLTEAYRERWLAWVDRCIADRAGCVTVAEARGVPARPSIALPASETPAAGTWSATSSSSRSGWRSSGTPPS
jgi:hypothetical protein